MTYLGVEVYKRGLVSLTKNDVVINIKMLKVKKMKIWSKLTQGCDWSRGGTYLSLMRVYLLARGRKCFPMQED